MQYRRARFWLSQFSWWAILAVLLACWTFVNAVTGQPLAQVTGYGLAAITLAILSLKER